MDRPSLGPDHAPLRELSPRSACAKNRQVISTAKERTDEEATKKRRRSDEEATKNRRKARF
jgi:hypothetical protein